MDVIHPRCAGVDISKRDAKVCVRIADPGRGKAKSTVTTWGAVTNQILALRDHLIAEEVTLVVMEATSDYWKQVGWRPRRRRGYGEVILCRHRAVGSVGRAGPAALTMYLGRRRGVLEPGETRTFQ